MRVLVTGSTGFVGAYTVAEALHAGHDVTALVRPASKAPFAALADHPRLTLARADLRDRRSLDGLFDEIDVVIHLAAAKSGDFATQFAGTVLSTENLLAAIDGSPVTRLVAVSTFSVYDYSHLKAGSVIDETTPIDLHPTRRDEYAQTKLLQEQLYRAEMERREVVILRPGMIYGRDNLWHALLGAELGPLFLRIGSRATLPMTYVENCVAAMVAAIDAPGVASETINIVDDDLPTQAEYVAALERQTEIPSSIPVPWPLMKLAATTISAVNNRFLDGRAKFPGIVVPEKLDGRFKPFRYNNDRARRLLGWAPQYTLAQAFSRSLSDTDLVVERAGSA
ncbi:MAG TPA: NAD(P)-dependent oxidoreductase [Microthrixaceae bacterium]|nr:NAD(P)-dependent oxidoreductase [Microthrixaceae bacterium]HQF93911.1 NAD(P)-dependent oxidoreductase [Microthrixaceae bacterium]